MLTSYYQTIVKLSLTSYTTLTSRCRTVRPQSHITKRRYLEAVASGSDTTKIVLDMRYPIGQDVKTIC